MQNVMFFVRSLLCAGIRLVTCVIEEHTVANACDDIVSGTAKFFRKVFRCKTKSKSVGYIS